MDTDTTTRAEPAWGTPPVEPAHWSLRKTLAAIGIALVLAAAGAAVIYAASGRSTGGPGGGGWGGPPPGGFDGPSQMAGGVTDALHGTFVVADGHGGFRTELTQTGTVTAITPSSVTSRSADGFTQTYVIGTDTRQGHQPAMSGDTVTIRAVQQGETLTATTLTPTT